jgi:3-phenylpropionate/trans-cinnamate dioxygenase ferredoxin component
MGSFVEAGKTSEFNDGMMKEVEIQGKQVLLARVGEKYFAASNSCPHMGGRLARGKLDGTIVTCPVHGSQFDLDGGHVVRWLKGSGVLSSIGKALKGQQPLTIYNVKVEGESILVEI